MSDEYEKGQKNIFSFEIMAKKNQIISTSSLGGEWTI
jgi:hypothetical protein